MIFILIFCNLFIITIIYFIWVKVHKSRQINHIVILHRRIFLVSFCFTWQKLISEWLILRRVATMTFVWIKYESGNELSTRSDFRRMISVSWRIAAVKSTWHVHPSMLVWRGLGIGLVTRPSGLEQQPPVSWRARNPRLPRLRAT